MESEKRFNAFDEESESTENSKPSFTEDKRTQKCGLKDGCQAKEKSFRPSMIPVMKNEKKELKSIMQKQRHSSSSSRLSCASSKTCKGKDFEHKLKLLEEKEKSIAEYYTKIEELIRKFVLLKEQKESKSIKRKTSQNSAARKMTSDPLVFTKPREKSDMLSEFESNVQEISDIWLKTSADLSNTLKNLKNSSSLDPMEFEIENVRIQLAIKQAKSLTLVKTRNVIAEAKKLFRNREMIRTELENLLSDENLKLVPEKSISCMKKHTENKSEKSTTTTQEPKDKQGLNGTGDSSEKTETENEEVNKEMITNTEDNENNRGKESAEKEALKMVINKPVSEDFSSEEKQSNSGESSKEQSEAESKNISETEIWGRELARKNETITNLSGKIFELQKMCNEHSLENNQLQVKLSEFHEKIQWNQVLWKQIGKLKEQIKGLQQSNKQLESQKKELESKITKLDQELDRLIKLNQLLNKKRYLLNEQEFTTIKCTGGECRNEKESRKLMQQNCHKEMHSGICSDEKVLAEKQNAINQLKSILNVMRDQEIFAQKQISVFQSKIDELEKIAKA